MSWQDDQNQLKQQKRELAAIGVFELKNYRRFRCGHTTDRGTRNGDCCFECVLKQRRFTPAEIQAEMPFNTEPIGTCACAYR